MKVQEIFENVLKESSQEKSIEKLKSELESWSQKALDDPENGEAKKKIKELEKEIKKLESKK
jgi:hypothetical protein